MEYVTAFVNMKQDFTYIVRHVCWEGGYLCSSCSLNVQVVSHEHGLSNLLSPTNLLWASPLFWCLETNRWICKISSHAKGLLSNFLRHAPLLTFEKHYIDFSDVLSTIFFPNFPFCSNYLKQWRINFLSLSLTLSFLRCYMVQIVFANWIKCKYNRGGDN